MLDHLGKRCLAGQAEGAEAGEESGYFCQRPDQDSLTRTLLPGLRGS